MHKFHQLIPDVIESEVLRAISEINKATSTGTDSLPASSIKTFSKLAIVLICNIFSSFIKEGFVPDIWKVAYVTPIFKNRKYKI